jgi:hypothetical protein
VGRGRLTTSAAAIPTSDPLNDGRESSQLRLDGLEVRIEPRRITALAEAPAQQLRPPLQDGEGRVQLPREQDLAVSNFCAT